MFGWFRKGTLLGSELTHWQFDCFGWLLRHTGGLDALRQRPLVQPTPQFFPERGLQGHAMAEAIFARVREYAGMADWPCVLQAQEADPNPVVAPALLVKGSPSSPAGTFRATEDGALITYHPNRVRDPMSLVATFAHELAHYRTAGCPEPPPGGWDVWEHATDLAAVFLGFGLFLANSRFSFSQFSDGQTMGWQWRQQGYLSEPEILHMHAIRCVLLGTPARETLDHLKPALRGIYKRVQREVERSTAELDRLRASVSGLQSAEPAPVPT
ncbi:MULTISPECIES: hypothetical protein [unclassified Dyella]|uniref:hypothetical protein n=1 Tax=unclassified Dyella TaxID=2634549 RepID=UPI000CB11155|nr:MULTISPECIES: hypothetical protein [unclassified Dyella]MDR3447016.1 hypothetical protein [Dyella sp.]PMQ05843.1 hypothetical protein DyAD56_06255 [Dyella sp. AD56]